MTERNSTTDKPDKQRKIIFPLEKDEDDYPPDDYEGIWADSLLTGHYAIDNIPFFVRDISPGDIVAAREEDGSLFFDRLVQGSGSSVIRVIAYDESIVPRMRSDLQALGCETEQSHIPNLISLEVPEGVELNSVIEFLDVGATENEWEYETASIRH